MEKYKTCSCSLSIHVSDQHPYPKWYMTRSVTAITQRLECLIPHAQDCYQACNPAQVPLWIQSAAPPFYLNAFHYNANESVQGL